MKTFQFLFTCLLLSLAGVQVCNASDKPRIVFISGEYEYNSKETFPVFKKFLETNYPVQCEFLQRPDDKNIQTIDGLDALEHADLVILMIRRMTLPEAQLSKIQNYIKSGKPLIGLRTASHSFENWKSFDHDVLGGNYGNHHNNSIKTTVRVIPEAATHPILKNVKGFESPGSLYRNTPLGTNTTALLVGSIPDQKAEPVAWVNMPKGSQRVFYTSLGHPLDFSEPNFKQLLVNAVFWALNKPVPEPAKQGD